MRYRHFDSSRASSDSGDAVTVARHHSYQNRGESTGLGRSLLIGSLRQRGDDPLPVAQGADLDNLERRQ